MWTVAPTPGFCSEMFRHLALLSWTDDATGQQKQAARDGPAVLSRAIHDIRSRRFGDEAGLGDGDGHLPHDKVIGELRASILARRAGVHREWGE